MLTRDKVIELLGILPLKVPPATTMIEAVDGGSCWRKTIEYARSAFVRGTLAYGVYPSGHVFSKEMRERAYAFLQDHLTKKED
jgi:hypothetical protein